MKELTGMWWDRIVSGFTHAAEPDVTITELVLILLVAAALAIPRITWKYFGLFTTVVHELGHAFAAMMTGQIVSGITLKMDHSGTTSTYSRGLLRSLWSGFWGYPVPAVVGAVLVWAGFGGWGPAAMSVGAIILVVTVLFIRNFTGLMILAGAIGISALLVLAVPAEFTGHVTIALGLALLVGSVRDMGNLLHVHFKRRHLLDTSDAYILYRATHIPSPLWLILFCTVIGACWFFSYGSFVRVLV
mgnify:CR=1 FL=1